MTAPLRGRLLLAERYAELGLVDAARATLELAQTQDPDSAEVLEALCRLALAAGDGKEARRVAQTLAAREPGPASRLLLGEAQLVAGEHDAARFSFATVLEARQAGAVERARALLGRARVAFAEEDDSGAGAAAMTALDELVAADGVSADVAAPLLERAIGLAVRADRAGDVEAVLESSPSPPVPAPYCRALLLAARRSAGDASAGDADVEAALAACGDFIPARLRRVELRLRRRHRDAAARAEAIADLESLAAELVGAEGVSTSLLASVQLLLAAAFDGEPSEHDRAEAAYRRGLELRPGQLSAATRLASLARDRGDRDAALDAAVIALTIDPGSHLGWLAAARLCGAPGPADESAIAALLDAAEPGGAPAAGAARRLIAATAEVARAELLAGMYARGHRVKNLLGIAGSRARKANKLAAQLRDGVGDAETTPEAYDQLAERLADLESELTALYGEWARYLRSMHEEGSPTELVTVKPLLDEVVAAARATGNVAVELETGDNLPELHGDRMLLREALVNLVTNAVEACADGGAVTVSALVRTAGSAPVLEIAVSDSGPGIGERELARVTAPGYTTKESGSGLGLAVAERVIAAHRGRLLIDSEVGRGTVVTALLPFDLPDVGYSRGRP